ncbi:UNVERIFIED_CONTAM: G-type lectin S-receptor-like serine/threonine-protein kinase [Sesamum latifolium]|uniref:Receptor-like serine/threonine-protein kinase n=1 Tax=Sesamum latifolium TaxID=2727402 RepID=A0AAW2W9A0_9LAMI
MFLLLFILFSAVSVVADDISPGSSLYASNPEQSWNSPNNSFSLSFIQESENTYFAAIIYNGIPIWKAGGDPGGAVDSSAALRFLQDGNLQLVVGSTGSLVWQSNTSGLGITSASLEDSGNFILKNGSFPIWTTFDNPTDTILPGQNFTVDHVLRCGLYSFRLLRSGEIALRWNDSIVYYTSSGINTTGSLNLTSPSLRMQPVGIFSLFDPSLVGEPIIMARDIDYGEVSDNTLRFVKLDCDGNMRIYSSAMSSGRGSKDGCDWTVLAISVRFSVIVGDLEFAGTMSLMLIQPAVAHQRILIRSIRGMVGKDPELSSDLFTANIRACPSLCLTDTSCVASTSLADGTGVCYMKRSAFVSGYQSPTLTSTSYVKVCEPAMPNPPFSSSRNDKKSASLKIAVVILGCSLALVILVVGLVWLYCRSKPKYESLLPHYSVSDYASGLPVQFSYKELQRETKGFKEKLGEGGFGCVYKGTLSNKMVVAVKQLEGIGQGEKQFRMEVATISSTHHLNLVRLVGFCSEGRHRLLVYEFMKNGSLDSFLFTSKDKKVLTWARRYSIALGTARGIMYLHEECRDCILHCDIKPENILLDENYNARISDFGLAKLLNLNDHKHRSLITVRGTRGYLAPEWAANLPITSKADVYSYGMVLLELVSGKRNFEVSPETNHKKFSLWAYEEFEKGNVEAVLDKQLMKSDIDMVQAMRVIKVSFWCIQERPSFRPTMGKVVQMLEGIADIHKPPPPLALVEGSAPASTVYSSQMSAISSLASE